MLQLHYYIFILNGFSKLKYLPMRFSISLLFGLKHEGRYRLYKPHCGVKNHTNFCVKSRAHFIFVSPHHLYIWSWLTYLGLCFLPRCLSERRNTLLIGRLNSSRSACSTTHPLSVDYCGNISPVKCLPSPHRLVLSLHSDQKIVSLPPHHVIT